MTTYYYTNGSYMIREIDGGPYSPYVYDLEKRVKNMAAFGFRPATPDEVEQWNRERPVMQSIDSLGILRFDENRGVRKVTLEQAKWYHEQREAEARPYRRAIEAAQDDLKEELDDLRSMVDMFIEEEELGMEPTLDGLPWRKRIPQLRAEARAKADKAIASARKELSRIIWDW